MTKVADELRAHFLSLIDGMPQRERIALKAAVIEAFNTVREDERERTCKACRELVLHGTDGCRHCDVGRVTLYAAGDRCVGCKRKLEREQEPR